MEKVETFYSKRTWLNPNDSPSTGNIVAFDGIETIDGKPYVSQFFKVSDCYHIANIHKAEYDTKEDFVNKLILMRNELNLFINHLKNNKNRTSIREYYQLDKTSFNGLFERFKNKIININGIEFKIVTDKPIPIEALLTIMNLSEKLALKQILIIDINNETQFYINCMNSVPITPLRDRKDLFSGIIWLGGNALGETYYVIKLKNSLNNE